MVFPPPPSRTSDGHLISAGDPNHLGLLGGCLRRGAALSHAAAAASDRPDILPSVQDDNNGTAGGAAAAYHHAQHQHYPNHLHYATMHPNVCGQLAHHLHHAGGGGPRPEAAGSGSGAGALVLVERRKLSVPTLLWHCAAAIVQLLAARSRPRQQRQWSRSFAPAHVLQMQRQLVLASGADGGATDADGHGMDAAGGDGADAGEFTKAKVIKFYY